MSGVSPSTESPPLNQPTGLELVKVLLLHKRGHSRGVSFRWRLSGADRHQEFTKILCRSYKQTASGLVIGERALKDILTQYIEALLIAAQSRNMSQGVKIYEMALDQLRAADSDSAVLEVLSRLKAALGGMETHGFFPADEYRVVEKIRALP